MFLPGETVTHEFYVPILPSQIKKVIVSYKQKDKIILEKTLTGGNILSDENGSRINYTLTQEESLLFNSPDEWPCTKKTTEYTVQLNILMTGGTRAVSVPMKGETGIQHVREVMSNG